MDDIKKFEQRTQVGKITDLSADVSSSAMLMQAIQMNYSPEFIEKMMDLRDREEARNQEKAFNLDMAAFKCDEPEVIKDKINALHKSKYVSTENLLTTVNPYLGKHNFHVRFNPIDSENFEFLTLEAILKHRDGHFETARMSLKIETTGAKGGQVMTDTHARMSALTYLMRATFSSVTGIAALDPRHDDDGNANSKQPEYISEKQSLDLHERIEKIYGDNSEAFLKFMKVKREDQILLKDLPKAIKALDDVEKNLNRQAKK